MMIEVSPLMVFKGNCEETFEFYRSVFDDEYQFIYRYRVYKSEFEGASYEHKKGH